METSRDRILEALEAHMDGLCDDCLSRIADVTNRAQVNMITRPLSERGITRRDKRACPSCGGSKFVNALREVAAGPPQVGESPVAYGSEPLALDAPAAAMKLDAMRRELVRMFDVLEGARSSGRNLPERLSGLQEAGAVPPVIACMMHTLNKIRGLTYYDEIPLGADEHAAVIAAWSCVQRWWAARQREPR